MTANIILADQMLGQYGPDARQARLLLRNAIPSIIDRLWSDSTGERGAAPFAASGAGEMTYRAVRGLRPSNDEQRFFQVQALQALTLLAQTRFILFEQSSNNIPTPFLVVLVFWLALLFTSFTLFSPMSPTALGALVLIALSASGAIFLILEMYDPFAGLMQLDSEPMRRALAPLD
jgi:hypothetical protein